MSNVALNKPVSGSVGIGNAARVVDGDASDPNLWADGGGGLQWLQVDFGSVFSVTQVKLWHYYGGSRAYHDVIVQLSQDPTFATGVTTLFNNDADNTAGQGAGTDAEYTETAAGLVLDFAAVSARYVRTYANGNTVNEFNHYVELMVEGGPLSASGGAAISSPTTATATGRKGADDSAQLATATTVDASTGIKRETPVVGAGPKPAEYVAIAVDNTGRRLARFPGAKIGDTTWTLNDWPTTTVELPKGAPRIRQVQAITSELQLYRNGELLDWFVPLRPQGRPVGPEFKCAGIAWWLSRRHIGKANRTNHLKNPGFEEPLVLNPLDGWVANERLTASERVQDWRFLGDWALSLQQNVANIDSYAVQHVPAAGAQLWTLAAWAHLRTDTADMPVGTFDQAFDGRGLFVAAIQSTTGEVRAQAFAPLSPRNFHEQGGSYRCEVSLAPPADFDGYLDVRVYAPRGKTVWDACTLTLNEGLKFHQVDQVDIVKALVAHAQDPAFGKTDENIAAAGVGRGVRRDKVWNYADHDNIWQVIKNLTQLDAGPDVDVEVTRTTRTLTVYDPARGQVRDDVAYRWGGLILDYGWDEDGSQACDRVTALSDGDGPDREEGYAVDETGTWGGHALETVVGLPDTPIYLLDPFARRYLTARADVSVGRITVPAEGTIGRVRTGDTIPIEIDDDWTQVTGLWRVVQMTLHPDSDTLDLVVNST